MTEHTGPTEHTGDTLIHGGSIVLRPISTSDAPWLREVVSEPSVARWWNVGSGTSWIDELSDDDDVHGYLVELSGGERVGFVQWSEEPDPAYRHASIDLFLITAAQGRGLGTEVVRTLARWLVDERGHHRIEIDPAAGNARAIRCYERVGFRRIGVARHRERTNDGRWRDSLLLDLLSDELP